MPSATAIGPDTWRTATYQEAIETLVRLLSPLAPFITEALWQQTGGFGRSAPRSPYAGAPTLPFEGPGSIHQQSWPTWEEALTRDEIATIVVQVNGRVRDRVEVPAEATEEEVRAAALASPKVQSFVTNPAAARFVYVPGRILNIVGG